MTSSLKPGTSLPHLLDTLLHTPRRSLLRRAAFQVHLWCGLVIGVYTALIGLTGSVLVVRPEIEHLLRPQLYSLPQMKSVPKTRPTLDDMMRQAERTQPSFMPVGFEDLPRTAAFKPESPLILYMAPRVASPHFAPASRTPDQWMVYFDPRDGKILGSGSRYSGLLGFTANLHYYLLAGAFGYLANGVLAVLFLLLCLSGWLLWWPGLRRGFAALRIHGLARAHRGRIRLKRLNWDLHTVGGFWSNPALIAVILTGIYFVFPRAILSIAVLGSPKDLRLISEWFSSPPISHNIQNAREISIQQAWMSASSMCPPDTRVQYLALPALSGASYEAIIYYPRTAPYSQPLRIFVDRYTGVISKTLDSRLLPPVLRASLYVYAVHFGSFAGTGSRILWFLLGLTPGALFVSGLIMWWLRVRTRRPSTLQG